MLERDVSQLVQALEAAPLAAPALQKVNAAMRNVEDYFRRVVGARRRDLLMPALEEAGFRCYAPRGAYYVMTDISEFGFADDVAFATHLVRDVGVAVVPGSSFYSRPELGRTQVRFTFCKRDETLLAAAERLRAGFLGRASSVRP